MNTRKKAIEQIKSFLQSNEQILLLTGTYQNEKHILALSTILSECKNPKTILFRANSARNFEDFVAPLLKLPKAPKPGIPFKLPGGHVLYFDSINPVSWRSSPNKIDIAIVYPIDSLDYGSGDECVNQLQRRNPEKMFLVSWTDDKNFAWTAQFNPVSVTFDAEEENPEYHKRMVASLSNTPKTPTITKKLPAYAQSTPEEFLIRILCRGRCRSTTWAKLNAPYPGKSAIRKAPMGTYNATCLKCGYKASDNYNWYR